MSSKTRILAAPIALAMALFLAAPSASLAENAKLGPYFPLPEIIQVYGVPKEALLRMTTRWLKEGLGRLEKAQKETAESLEKAKAGGDAKPETVAPLEEKLKTLDANIASTKEQIQLAEDEKDLTKERQAERKRQMILIVDQWINELGRQATQALKTAIMSDGMQAEVAQNQHIQLNNMADDLEKAKHHESIENWALR